MVINPLLLELLSEESDYVFVYISTERPFEYMHINFAIAPVFESPIIVTRQSN